MIKYYDSEAAYEADVKSDFESKISLIGENNAVKYDGCNVIVDICSAKTGSIVVLDGMHAMHFVSVDSYSSASFMSNYEVIGIVRVGVDHPSFRGQIIVMHKTYQNHKMCSIYQYRLSGYNCDGTDRTGTLSVRQASDSWAANHDYTITYNATDEVGLVEQMNAYFRANEPFSTQQWNAVLNEDNTIDLQFNFTDSRQSSAAGKSGFVLKYNLLQGWIASDNMIRKNGYRYSSGAIANWSRALYYFRQDLINAAYNPSDDVTSIKRGLPICLPGYLGTSKYQIDHCAFLRSVYGEGEQGWLKFMSDYMPLRPTAFGSNGEKEVYGDARRNTYYLASTKYADINGVEQPVSPAAAYVAGIGYDHDLARRGQWVLPDSDIIFDLTLDIDYPATNNIDTDVINRALKVIGCPAFISESNVWTCSRSSIGAWFNLGAVGFMYFGSMNNAYMCVPLLLLDVPKNAS